MIVALPVFLSTSTVTLPCGVASLTFQTGRLCRSSDSTSMTRLCGTFALAISRACAFVMFRCAAAATVVPACCCPPEAASAAPAPVVSAIAAAAAVMPMPMFLRISLVSSSRICRYMEHAIDAPSESLRRP